MKLRLMRMFYIKSTNILKINSLFILLIVLLLASCDLIKFKENRNGEQAVQQEPIARVKDIYLYPHDMEGAISKNLSPEDSANRMEQLINSWIRKQLIISEASSRLSFDEAELERRLLDYKYALMVHKFEEQYVNQELDKEVTSKEISNYYKENIDNFRLNQNIIRGIFVQLPKEAPRINKFKRQLSSGDPKRREDVISYCHSYATKAHLGDSTWVYFEQVIVNTPFQDIANKQDFLEENTFVEREDDKHIYLLKVLAYKTVNQISPIEFVWEEIEKIILNKRKIKLVNELENEIFERAKENSDFETYENK